MGKLTKKQTYGIFIAKFVFSLLMIGWTILWTLKADIFSDEENTFFDTYHNIDFEYNKIVATNEYLNKKYNFEIVINNYKINKLDFKDIYLPKRVIEKRKDKKNILVVGKNSFNIKVLDQNGQNIPFVLELVVSKPTTNKPTATLTIKDNKNYDFNIPHKAYFDIMGKITIDKYQGYFLIKTNAK
jgi:hypothetical protein